MLPVLTGERVRLRPLTSADLPQLLAIFGDPLVSRFIGIPLLRDERDAQILLTDIHAQAEARLLYQWGLEAVEPGLVVGTCTLASFSWQHQRAEIGFALANAEQGRGLMTEGLRLLMDHAFGELRLHRLEADVDPRNERSLRLLERLGFQREGFARQRHLIDGERQDSVLLGLLASEWRR